MRATMMLLLLGLLASCSKSSRNELPPAPAGSGASDIPGDATARAIGIDLPPPPMKVVDIAAGDCWATTPACGIPGANAGREIDDVRQHIEGFRIDYATVDCDQWDACVTRGACPALSPRDACRFGHATVSRPDAATYCAARGGQLPSYAQWQRAIRGETRQKWPMGEVWDPAKACLHPTNPDGFLKRCEHESASGVRYAMENPNGIEWTRDDDCLLESDGSQRPFMVGVNVGTDTLGIRWPGLTTGEFRCVYPPATSSTPGR